MMKKSNTALTIHLIHRTESGTPNQGQVLYELKTKNTQSSYTSVHSLFSSCVCLPMPQIESITYLDLGFIQRQIDNNLEADEKRLCWENACSIFIPTTGNTAMNATIPVCFRLQFSQNRILLIAIQIEVNYIDQTFTVVTISKLFKHTWKHLFVNKKKTSTRKITPTSNSSKEYVQTSATKTYVFRNRTPDSRAAKKTKLQHQQR